ncbi:MAG: hypothetical protein HS103_05080 [Anaerolineales bacterium]|nr:hypothetical protein [Anaerolineales bacterium]
MTFSQSTTSPMTGETPVNGLISIRLDVLIIAVLLAAAFVLRLPNVDVIPLNNSEAREAFAAYKVLSPTFPGETPTSRNPLLFAATTLSLTIGGAEHGAARLPSLLIGLVLTAMPYLFRRWLGATQMVILIALLAFSPVVMLAARGMQGALWSAVLALLTVYGFGMYAEVRRAGYASLGVVGLLLLIFAAEPAGFLTAAGLGVGLVFALASGEDRTPGAVVGDVLKGFPRGAALFAALTALIVVGSVFLIAPMGLQSLSESINAGLRGLSERPPGVPAILPLIISLTYEPVLWVMGLAGAYIVLFGEGAAHQRGQELLQRGLLGWFVASVAWALAYGGTESGHALWLTLPLAGLSAVAIERALTPVQDPFWRVPRWAVWVQAVAMVALLMILLVNLAFVGRDIVSVPADWAPPLTADTVRRALLIPIGLLLSVITFFLAGSIWGARTAWRGAGLGLLLFLGGYGINAGFGAALVRPDDPRELWHIRPSSLNLNLLEDALETASLRATGKRHEAEVVVYVPPGMRDYTYSPLAWTLRHFHKLRYVQDITPAITAPIVIARKEDTLPDLGGQYVGQDFVTWRTWEVGTMQYWDIFPWLYNRLTRAQPTDGERVILWVRSDVYGVGDIPGAGQ